MRQLINFSDTEYNMFDFYFIYFPTVAQRSLERAKTLSPSI